MARYSSHSSYSHSGSYRSSGHSSSYRSSGHSGSVSSARLHQHTGTSFGGYTKTYNPGTGHYSMQPSSGNKK